MKSVLDRVENIVTSIFSFLAQCFEKTSSWGSLKVGIIGKVLNRGQSTGYFLYEKYLMSWALKKRSAQHKFFNALRRIRVRYFSYGK